MTSCSKEDPGLVSENKMDIENVLVKNEYSDEEECNIVEEELYLGNEGEAETSNEKPYKCGICGHRTTSDTLLKVHMKMHLVKRVHQCSVCKRTFNFVTELNSHILMHTEDKSNFQCEICSRACFTEEDLQRHYRVHTKEKPFKCKLCFRAFSDDSYLRVHERSHHGEDYLRKTMKKDGTYVDPSLVQNFNENDTPKVSVEETSPPKKFKNNPSLPLSNEEKLLLLQNVEKLGLNKSYPQLEQMKSCLKNNWAKMTELFAEQDYDRNPEKLARTYFHLKNKAKTHIERFYKHKKLPEPNEVDYMFVKLCPSEFEFLGIDIERVLEDGKKFQRKCTTGIEIVTKLVQLLNRDDRDDDKVESLLRIESQNGPVSPNPVNDEAPSCSQKRTLSEIDDVPPRKKLKTEDEDTLNEINRLKLKFLLAEEQRKNHLYEIELKAKEELFSMERKHKEEIYRKEVEIKNLELKLLRQKSHQ